MGVQTRFGRLCVIVSASMLAMAVAPPPGQADDGGRDDASRAHVTEEKSVRVTKSGVVVQTVRVGDSTVTTYGPDAPPVSVTLHGRTASASISVEPSRRSQRPFDPTVFEMTLASGHFSRQEACAFAKAIDPRGCVTAATLRDRRASDRRSAQVAAATEFLDSRCWTFTHEPGDGTKYNYNCNYRRTDFENQNLWLVSNRMQATGWEEDGGTCCDYLQGVGVRAGYDDNDAHAVEWAPGERDIDDSCRSVTTAVSSSRTGTSYSVSNEVCPNGWLHGTRRHSSTSGRNGPDRVLLTRTDGVPSPPHWFASTGPAPDRIFWRRG
jgi:hypothetical protein